MAHLLGCLPEYKCKKAVDGQSDRSHRRPDVDHLDLACVCLYIFNYVIHCIFNRSMHSREKYYIHRCLEPLASHQFSKFNGNAIFLSLIGLEACC
ncbi:hypothetical protein Scep_001852 [Stephania cephalantha]|uniref:Uncharacterized protein n=1 Tax=Stephania cephalantha TaxID=152367 RepID=A0AAP0Q864_9MAGN